MVVVVVVMVIYSLGWMAWMAWMDGWIEFLFSHHEEACLYFFANNILEEINWHIHWLAIGKPRNVCMDRQII
jgi:hypothetical protein